MGSTRIISAAGCSKLIEPPRRMPPAGCAMLERAIRPFEEVVVHAWPDEQSRQVVIPVEAGLYDGDELVSVRDALRLSQFKNVALVGLTTVPEAHWFWRKTARPFAPEKVMVPLGGAVWFDLIDRARGAVMDYDDAFHVIARQAKLSWLDAYLRGGFRHIPSRAGGPASADSWIREILLVGFPMIPRFYIRPISGEPGGDGRPRRFLIDRSDWEREREQAK